MPRSKRDRGIGIRRIINKTQKMEIFLLFSKLRKLPFPTPQIYPVQTQKCVAF